MEKTNKRMTREERRKQILESALKVFIEKGYNGSTTLDIAKKQTYLKLLYLDTLTLKNKCLWKQ